MNHLAHCLLSFDDDDLLVGNFIADYVKGRSWQEYAPGVQRGILLHRAIDAFTDEHAAVRQSISRIRPAAGRFSGPAVDILYDFVLASQWNAFEPVPFDAFAEKTYASLNRRRADLPSLLQDRLPYMLAGKFLHGYQSREGLDWVLQRFGSRLPAAGGFNAKAVSELFFSNTEEFTADFQAFFPALKAHAEARIKT